MGMTEIIKKTITTMKNEGVLLSPANYQEYFCKEAKKEGLVLEDCNDLERHINKLDAALKKELQTYRLRNTDELLSFLNGKIKRLEPHAAQEMIQALTLLIKRMAQVAEQMHNKDLAVIAARTIDNIEKVHNVTSIDTLKEQWMHFLTTYDDSFLDRLSSMGSIDKSDLQKSVHSFVDNFNRGDSQLDVSDNLGKILIAALAPSIASSMNDEIAVISSQIRQDPHVLDTQAMQEDIRFAIKKRIELDKSALKSTVNKLDEIADEVSKRLLHIIKQSQTKKEALGNIKKELEGVDMSDKSSLTAIHKKLLDVATLLEAETSQMHKDFQTQQAKISDMDEKIKALEAELEAANQESRLDFLTKVHNKRALEEKLAELDAEYKRFNRDFSLFFIDIDFFKNINDTYGHDAGDMVLKIFAQVLKKQSREVDFIARFGGEEFVIILPETTKKGALEFANKLRAILEKNRFVYQNNRLKITISGGISQRSEEASIESLVKKADAYVYEAKANGRNKILPQ